jgi:ribosomal protein S26
MKKVFCDRCGMEIPANEADKTLNDKYKCSSELPNGNSLDIVIHAGTSGKWGEGDFCVDCVVETVKQLGTGG